MVWLILIHLNSSKFNNRFHFKRVPKKRNYIEEGRINDIKPIQTENHPLKIILDNQAQLGTKSSRTSSKSSVISYSDPLSDLASQDPLSKMVADVTFKEKV